jgi:hypothetical protein
MGDAEMSASSRIVGVREERVFEPIIHCPECEAEIKLTESLAAPLLKSREAEFKRQEAELREREAVLRRERDSLERDVIERTAAERKKVAEEEKQKARLALGIELETKQRELKELNEILRSRDEKLAEAQRAQAEVVRRERQIAEEKRQMELTIEKRVSASLNEMRMKARQEVEDELKLKVSEKDQVIQSMQRQIEELRRKAEQGSQQLQGEVLELELESLLGRTFGCDTVTRVPKGEFGGDVLHRVMNGTGVLCGTILWESKRTKTFSESWLAKLRRDQRAAKADVAVIVSQALPKNVKHLDLIDGVYVVSPQCVLPVAAMMRKELVDLASVRRSSEGRETKAAVVYQYCTGPRFRQHMQAIVEAFASMQDDLNAEKRATQKQWAKREVQIERVIASTAALYGDLQGIVGRMLIDVSAFDVNRAADCQLRAPLPITEPTGA